MFDFDEICCFQGKHENLFNSNYEWVAGFRYELFPLACFCLNDVTIACIQGRRERGGHGGTRPPAPFLAAKFFFLRNIGTHKIFTCEEHMRLEFIYWTRHKWQKLDSFFSFCHFSSKLSYHSYHQRVCKIMFPIMCGSFLLCQVIARTADTKTESKIISRLAKIY